MFGAASESNQQDEIAEMLFSAGYFRARIKMLPPFDMVVGGLAWAVTMINMEVDLSLDETANLGQKIKLGEQICKVLYRMKGPPLQSHQIKGLDYGALFPVAEWLIKRVIETRAETEAATRKFSELQFDKEQLLPAEAELLEYRLPSTAYEFKVRQQFKPTRQYRMDNRDGMAEAQRVQACMLEYGISIDDLIYQKADEDDALASKSKRGGVAGKNKALETMMGGVDDKSVREKVSSAEAEWQAEMAQDKARLEAMAAALEGGATGAESAVGNKMLNSIVGMSTEQIREQQEQNALMAEELAKLQAGSAGGAQAAHRRNMAGLERQRASEKKKAQDALANISGLQSKLEQAKADLKKQRKMIAKGEKMITGLNEKEAQCDKAELASLKRLVTLNESLKDQESSFKKNCKGQMKRLTSQLDKVGEEENADNDEVKRLVKIEELYKSETKKNDKVTESVSRKNREIMYFTRKIDEVPTRTELLQYERRFTELYDQIQIKLDETRKHYATYNALSDAIKYANKEIETLDNMHTAIGQGVLSSSSRAEHFLENMNAVKDGVVRNLDRVESDFQNNHGAKVALEGKLQEELTLQRKHFKAVKDFQMECEKNEELRKQAPVEA